MKILNNPEQAFVRVNQPQPDQFPRFYIIPETNCIPRRQRACNAHQYHQPPSLTLISPSTETAFRKYARIEIEIFLEFLHDTRSAIKDLGRDLTRWIARWVIMPLAIISSLYVPAIHPMDLPI
jgi:hypothetical protein